MDLMRRSAGNTTNGEFTIAFANGPIKFQSDEGVLYSRLFHIVRPGVAPQSPVRMAVFHYAKVAERCCWYVVVQVDTDSDGYIGGAEGAAFIRRARLLNDANREVWHATDPSAARCGLDCTLLWCVVVCCLVACVWNNNRFGGWRVEGNPRRS